MRTSRVRFTSRQGSGAIDLAQLHHQEVGQYKLLTPEEELGLYQRIKQGDQEAVEKLVLHNLRFAISCAREYARDHPGCGLEMTDLMAEAKVGLIRAARKFDPDRGVKFLSYAVWWIRQALFQATAEQGRTIRIPKDRSHNLARIKSFRSRFLQKRRRQPTIDEIAAETDLSLGEVTSALLLDRPTLSLTDPVGRGELNQETWRESLVADENHLNPEQYTEAREEFELLCARIRGLLAAVQILKDGKRRQFIFLYYYGLADGSFEKETLEKIGKCVGVTRERTRQLREATWKRLAQDGLTIDEEKFRNGLEYLKMLENIVGEPANLLEGPTDYAWFNEGITSKRKEQRKVLRTVVRNSCEDSRPAPEAILEAVDSVLSGKWGRRVKIFLLQLDLHWSYRKIREYLQCRGIADALNSTKRRLSADEQFRRLVQSIRSWYGADDELLAET